MSLQVRRVVTGHDANGKAVVTIDEMITGEPRRPGAEAATVWTSLGFPINNDGSQDEAQREGLQTTLRQVLICSASAQQMRIIPSASSAPSLTAA